MILTAHHPRRRSWRIIPQCEPISAARVGQLCVIGLTAGLLFCVLSCVVIDHWQINFSL